MSKLDLEKILATNGPCLSSELADILVERFGLTPAAARKRISRGSPNLKKLSYIIFPHRARFVYLKNDYASPKYWKALYSSLKKENSSYYMAIDSIRAREGMVRKDEFGIISGSPVRQKNHIPYESIISSLIKAEIILETSNENGDKYLYLKEFEDDEHRLLESQYKKEIIKGIMLEQARTWLKQLGLVSYGKAKAMGDETKNPMVGTFEWHITGPSYTHPLTKNSINGKKPGFIVCDLNTTPSATLDDIDTFIRKMDMTLSLKNIGNCIFVYISNTFTEKALFKAKSNGVLAITFSNVFGKRNTVAAERLGDILNNKDINQMQASEITKLTKELNERNGLTQNLKGKLFEFICADMKKKIDISSRILIGREYITSQGDKAEADITSIRDDISISFIECKAIKRESTLDDEQVDRWLDIRIPRLLNYCKSHTDYKHLKKSFELWVTGDLSEKAKLRINDFISKHPKNNIIIKKPRELLKDVKDINDRALKNLLFSYFLKREK
ncbi:hypothetical protein [Enterobacter roggenkampii]|uniref:hypothetical protein n=1 Tax=Enterobacter roggenkampii TaxID=1812935 RepID=UPI0022E94FB9|nr:hypothetical protein [Enterobacter roggenkampii]